MVEVTGLEPTTFWSLTRRATKLRYTSIKTLLQNFTNYKVKQHFNYT